jgi:hypothetical protein
MQVAIGPMGQFAPLALTIAPDPDRLAKLGETAGIMIIRHRFMCACGHYRLQNLACGLIFGAIRTFDKRHFVPLKMR